MKNVLDQKPSSKLNGRVKGCAEFVSLNDLKDKVVLDIGCGFGSFAMYALDHDVHEIIGIEVTEGDIATAKEHVKNEKAKFIVASAIDLPFEQNIFDTVVSFDVIEHIPKGTESKMFQQVQKVLKPGGYFYLSTPFQSFFSNIFDPAWWLVGHRHYSEKKLKKFAIENGFIVEEIQTKGGWWTCIGVLNMYVSKWIFRRAPFWKEFFQKKETEEYSKKKGFINIIVRYKKIDQ